MSEKVKSPEHKRGRHSSRSALARRPHGATSRPGRSLRRSIRTGGPNGQAGRCSLSPMPSSLKVFCYTRSSWPCFSCRPLWCTSFPWTACSPAKPTPMDHAPISRREHCSFSLATPNNDRLEWMSRRPSGTWSRTWVTNHMCNWSRQRN